MRLIEKVLSGTTMVPPNAIAAAIPPRVVWSSSASWKLSVSTRFSSVATRPVRALNCVSVTAASGGAAMDPAIEVRLSDEAEVLAVRVPASNARSAGGSAIAWSSPSTATGTGWRGARGPADPAAPGATMLRSPGGARATASLLVAAIMTGAAGAMAAAGAATGAAAMPPVTGAAGATPAGALATCGALWPTSTAPPPDCGRGEEENPRFPAASTVT